MFHVEHCYPLLNTKKANQNKNRLILLKIIYKDIIKNKMIMI